MLRHGVREDQIHHFDLSHVFLRGTRLLQASGSYRHTVRSNVDEWHKTVPHFEFTAMDMD